MPQKWVKYKINRGGKHKMNVKEQKGITLTILVITIIVILIIAGASLSTIFDQDGLLQSSQEAKELQENYANGEDKKTDELINILNEEMKK